MTESRLQLLTALIEQRKLCSRERIEVVTVRTNEVREHRTWYQCILMVQLFYEKVEVGARIEPQTVHSRVEFYMHRVPRNAFFLRCFNQCVQQTEAINLWFELVIEKRFERTHLWVHYHNVARNAVSAQRSTFVSHRNSKIIDAMVL